MLLLRSLGHPAWQGAAALVGVVGVVVAVIGVIVAIRPSQVDQSRNADDIATADTADSQPTPAAENAGQSPEPEPEPELAPVGIGAGVWEVGREISLATYVTTAPEGESCYWARLSGFTGDFEEIIANGNLNPDARGRIEILASDTSVEFSGGCQWVEVSKAEPAENGDEVGEGTWAIGDEVQSGRYTTTAPEGESCYWARLSGFTGDFEEIIANGNLNPDARGRIEILASDAGVEFSGGCTWTRN